MAVWPHINYILKEGSSQTIYTFYTAYPAHLKIKTHQETAGDLQLTWSMYSLNTIQSGLHKFFPFLPRFWKDENVLMILVC